MCEREMLQVFWLIIIFINLGAILLSGGLANFKVIILFIRLNIIKIASAELCSLHLSLFFKLNLFYSDWN